LFNDEGQISTGRGKTEIKFENKFGCLEVTINKERVRNSIKCPAFDELGN
jgi:hypothetical protein